MKLRKTLTGLAFIAANTGGGMGVWAQDFAPGRDTSASRRLLVATEPGTIDESFGISPDGRRVAVAMVSSYSTRFREGTNQVLTMASTGGDDRWFAPNPNLSIDSRGGGGPVWSPDGTKMAAVYEGLLAVWPVSRTGEPLGPPRRVTSEMAHSPSWAGDSKRLLRAAPSAPAVSTSPTMAVKATTTGNAFMKAPPAATRLAGFRGRS